MRLDQYIFFKGKAQSREKASYFIKNGSVTVNGKTVFKPSYKVADADEVSVTDTIGFVGKGGLKLKKAIECFSLDFNSKTVLDVGASTGGFTDCALKNGAKKVFAVDVGHNQLSQALKDDLRVNNMEGTNILLLQPSEFDNIDFITCDVSFVSLKNIIPHLKQFFTAETKGIFLVKPQFEAGKSRIKKGVVSDKRVHETVLIDMCAFFEREGLFVNGLDFSPIKGGEGNIEFLLLASLCDNGFKASPEDTVSNAHTKLKEI